MDNDLIERLRAFVVERGKLSCGSDIVSACNNSALRLADLRAILGALEAARADAVRLDWLNSWRGDDVRRDPRTGDTELVAHYWGVQGQCYGVREAIDAAMVAEGRDG